MLAALFSSISVPIHSTYSPKDSLHSAGILHTESSIGRRQANNERDDKNKQNKVLQEPFSMLPGEQHHHNIKYTSWMDGHSF